jgi:N4-gp56 family major capsid protein
MIRNSKVRFGLMFLFGLLALLHGPAAFLYYLFFMGIAFGVPYHQMRSGSLGMGAMTTTTNPADFADQSQVFFDRTLMDFLKYTLRLAKYAKVKGYDVVGVGGTNNVAAIRFFRSRKADLSGILAQSTPFSLSITPFSTPTALVEGVAPTVYAENKMGYVDIFQGQRGELYKITDIVTALGLFNHVAEASKKLGADAALDYDSVCRNGLINGVFNSNATYATGDGGYFERFAGVPNSGQSSTDFNNLSAAEPGVSKFTSLYGLANVTQLKRSKIPKIGNRYACLCPPEGIHDLRRDAAILPTWQYQDKTGLFQDGELELDGAVYIEANNPWIEGAAYGTELGTTAPPSNGPIYSAIYLGDEAFGAPTLNNTAAGGGGAAPEVVVIPPGRRDKTDPLGQFGFVGWKAFYGSAPLIASSRTNEISDRPRYTVFRFKSTFQ